MPSRRIHTYGANEHGRARALTLALALAMAMAMALALALALKYQLYAFWLVPSAPLFRQCGSIGPPEC